MNYEQALEFLSSRHTSIYRGLQRIRYVLEALGNPQHSFRSVLITGTNGKGSTAKMLSSILQEAGYRVGCFTSPHLIDFSERMTINGQGISQAEVVAFTEQIRTGPLTRLEHDRQTLQIEGTVSFFELVTAMAFLYFARHQVDIAVLEVGIGGRLDATNTVDPLVSVITNVGLDHQAFLGTTIADITREKSAIIREHGQVVTGCQTPEALAVIEDACKIRGATLYRTGVQLGEDELAFAQKSVPHTISSTGSLFSYFGLHGQYAGLSLPLVGRHQLANATIALAVLELLATQGFVVTEQAIRTGLAKVNHPGRLELIQADPRVVVDIAHNAMGAQAIADALTSIFAYEKLIVVIGVLHDKDVEGILRPFLQVADSLIFTSPHTTNRAETATATEQIARKVTASADFRHYDQWRIHEYVQEALEQAYALAGEQDLICVTGSNYTVSEADLYISTKAPKQK
ncbi:bifunctional folylpolyglutamate synthase/dihydrofolate synthase [candidate division KSB3 bacterium]|uniref:Dihydrofolate synthase/folylpolyglutamate synthase n=1 Tax=candidate division KSB3 bacterium TaxID=2044937 RepID=A0A9D5JWF1_9BACT|nr:bifunctional folylpolyglutamate synthase/dihydrofolate synthase [candidate division KSB3 bacterium]MBD3325162.1 bifunctional folylpolyglutamate synthase/dihydrofolate synthase [candidate division KSB3 bacterium]